MWVWIVRILRWVLVSLVWRLLKESGIGLGEISGWIWEQIQKFNAWYNSLKEPTRFNVAITIAIGPIILATMNNMILKTIGIILMIGIVVIRIYLTQIKVKITNKKKADVA